MPANMVRCVLMLSFALIIFSCKQEEVGPIKHFSTPPASGLLEIITSNAALTQGFNWAKAKTRTFVQTGKTGPVNISERDSVSEEVAYIPSYWAGYPLRTAFYSRDFCHQATGAHLLGLEAENFTMLKAFAASASESRQWYPLWAINFDGSPYALDYRDDDYFVREVPAVFELVEKAYCLYLWTGNQRYIQDDTLWNYYTKAVTDFITLHDQKIPNGVAEGTGTGNIFLGTPTFNEQADLPFIEAGDGLACQYRALWAYAKIAAARGEVDLANNFQEQARQLKTYFNTDWGVKDTERYNRGYTPAGEPVAGWGKENSWFMLMKGLTDADDPRTLAYLDFVNERLESKDDIPDNIEAISYVPEVFFLYHQNERGWKWMKHILATVDQEHAQSKLTGTNGNYPEVSYVLISNVVENLLGLKVDASGQRVETISHLPEEIDTLAVRSIRMGNALLSLRHIGHHTSVLKYESGQSRLQWTAGFPGNHDQLWVNDARMPVHQSTEFGQPFTYQMIDLEPGEEVIVSIHADQEEQE